MKRVVAFGGCGHTPAKRLNQFLTKHPSFELQGVVSAVNNDSCVLYCTVSIPDDVSSLSEELSDYLGFETEQHEETKEENEHV